jgi:hypothetical protein
MAGSVDPPSRKTADSARRDRTSRPQAGMRQELWLLLSLFLIAFVLNSLVASHTMLLGFYTLPTIYSAYKYGRRHAVLTAFASVSLVVLLTAFNPTLFSRKVLATAHDKWFELAVWGGILVVTAYAMGTLYENQQAHLRELRESYQGILMILQHIASNDKYSQNHPYRVSICATKIAERMELSSARIEDLRAAALLHDVDKLGISREVLYKSANITQEDFEKHPPKAGKDENDRIGGSLRRVIPIMLSYQARLDAEGNSSGFLETMPLEARILAVADTYETLTSNNSLRLAPQDAIENIKSRAGVDFDPQVVKSFIDAYQYGRMQMA